MKRASKSEQTCKFGDKMHEKRWRKDHEEWRRVEEAKS